VGRLVGVTILAILQTLLGILTLLGGIAMASVGFVLPEIIPHVRWFAFRSLIFGLGLVVFAFIDFILAYGLWNGKGWAWNGSLVFALIGIVFSVFSLFVNPRIGELVSLIIDLVIVYYLMQPRVHAYFGRGRISALAAPAQTQLSATTEPKGSITAASAACPSCGSAVSTGMVYCASCGTKLS
jgi:hypothetical protein